MNYAQWAGRNFDRGRDWALVTGGTSGIGLEYADLICAQGCNCIILSDEAERLPEVAALLAQRHGVHVRPVFCDLADYAATLDCCRRLAGDLHVRVLVNNAGFGLKGRFESIDMERYRDIVNVNALAQTVFSHVFLPEMKKHSAGLHINVATINVVSPIPFNAVYTATKFYVYAYALAVAQEYCGSGIDFQVLLPGTTDTPFHGKQGSTASAMTMSARSVAEISLRNIGRLVCIPNRGDVFLYHLSRFIPTRLKIRISQRVAQKRLGLNN